MSVKETCTTVMLGIPQPRKGDDMEQHESNPWNDGYSARYNCKERNTNPYFDCTGDPIHADAQKWDEGWFFADSEIKTMP